MTGIQLAVIKRQFERLESNFKLMLGVNEALSLRITELEALHDFELPTPPKPKSIIAKRYKAKARERK